MMCPTMGLSWFLMRNLRDISRLYDMYDVLGLDRKKNVIVCPLPAHVHRNNTPSFGIFIGKDGVQHFRCLGNCGIRGDVIDLVGYLNIPGYSGDNPQDVRKAVTLLSNKFEWSPPPPVERVVSIAQNEWEKFCPPGKEAIQYALARGISEVVISAFRLGQKEDWLSIPVFEDGMLIGIKLRSIGKSKRYVHIKGSRSGIFNYDAVAWKKDPFLLVKGEIAAMVCVSNGILACAPTSGEAMKIEKYAPALAFSKRVVVVGDNDPGDLGVKTRELARVRAEAIGADLKFPPSQYKDIDDWILADPEAVKEIRTWLQDV